MDGYITALTLITGFCAILSIYCAYCEEKEKEKRRVLEKEKAYYKKRVEEAEKILQMLKKENTLYKGLYDRKEIK